MKVLLINGSSNEFGCTRAALDIISKEFVELGIEPKIMWIGKDAINDFDGVKGSEDIVNKIGEELKTSDGLIVGSPTWYSHPTGRLLCVLDRLSGEYKDDLAFKPAAAVLSARRAGQVASIDIINKHFTINQMPVVSSTYWNVVYGSKPEEVYKDEEGVATMINLACNMAWLIKSIKIANLEKPVPIRKKTNFHR